MQRQGRTQAIYQARLREQTAGVEELPGTYPFTLERSVRAYRLNKFLHQLIHPEFRRRFRAEPESLFREHELTDEEAAMVARRDWRALIQYGASFSCWRNWARSSASRTCTFTRRCAANRWKSS